MPRWMRPQPSMLKNWIPQRLTTWLRGPAGAALGMLLVGGLAFGLGRSFGLGTAVAIDPPRPNPLSIDNLQNAAHLYPDDYSGRVVAYIYGNIPVTRTELAEYLIARFGQERLKFLVNRKIVDKACHVMGINITDNEVELQFRKDLAALGPGVTPEIFHNTILKKYNKSIFEWKEDVIRPKLAVQRMIEKEKIEVTDAEVFNLFEIRHGPKVQCRMIVYRDVPSARAAWQKMREAPSLAAAFLSEATNQYIKELCPEGGKVPPIHKHFTSREIEQTAFGLKPGEMSNVIEMPDRQAIILMCDVHLAADPSKSYDRERSVLLAEMIEQKKTQMMQDRVKQLGIEAAPRYILARQPSNEQIRSDAKEFLEPSEPPFKKTP